MTTIQTTDRCTSCGALIAWKLTSIGKRIPLDPVPVDRGNVVLSDDGRQAYVIASEDRLLDETEPRYVSHFATCPKADEHRKPRR